jgi:hypothetical protein
MAFAQELVLAGIRGLFEASDGWHFKEQVDDKG